MPRYKVWYIEGPNYELKKSREQIIEAASFTQALAPLTNWPVVENYTHTGASAWNPGTCMYYQQLWEALLLNEESAAS